MQNENPSSESNISSTNNEKMCKSKISTENEHHRANSSYLAKENNKDNEKKMRKRNQNLRTVLKKDPNSGRFYN